MAKAKTKKKKSSEDNIVVQLSGRSSFWGLPGYGEEIGSNGRKKRAFALTIAEPGPHAFKRHQLTPEQIEIIEASIQEGTLVEGEEVIERPVSADMVLDKWDDMNLSEIAAFVRKMEGLNDFNGLEMLYRKEIARDQLKRRSVLVVIRGALKSAIESLPPGEARKQKMETYFALAIEDNPKRPRPTYPNTTPVPVNKRKES